MKTLRPQEGTQTEFLKSKADIVIFGGSAGGGKTFALLLEALWYHDVPGFTCMIFRKNANQIRNPGGLLQNSQELFREFGGELRESLLEWKFRSGSVIKFAHLDVEKDKFSHQGAQYTTIMYDELTHFSRSQFMYMLSRNRSLCGIKPFIRATCNPDCDSWVKDLIQWWLNPDTGYPIPERSGVVRWFVILGDETIWSDSKEELEDKYSGCMPKSLCFISSSIYDNKILLSSNPEYLANLQALPKFEREQLLHGNWNIRPTAGMFFKKSYFEVVERIPKGNMTSVRYWDRASTKETGSNNPDYTVGLKLEKTQDGVFYVTDIVRLRESPLGVINAIKNTASQDGNGVRIGLEQDPGQAGVCEVDHLVRQLQGYPVYKYKVSKDKVTRSLPVSSQAEAGNIKVLKARWNEAFFQELENFPEGGKDDQIDSLSGAYNMMSEKKYDLSSMSRW